GPAGQLKEATHMRRAWCWGVFVLVSSAPVLGAEPGKLVEEFWEVAHVDGARVGSVHTTVRQLDKRLRATADMELTFRRHGAALRLRMEHGTEETPEGKVVGVFMRQEHERGRALRLVGALDGGKMHVKVDGGRIERKLPWGDDVVGLYKLERLFAARKPKAGDSFTLRRYEPTLNAVVTVRVAVKGPEKVQLNGARKELLRVDLVPDKVVVPGHSVQPPKSVWWLDGDFVPVRRQVKLDGLGAVVLTRTTKELARAPAPATARAPDIGLKTLVPLDRAIARPYATRSAVYKVTVRGDDEAESALARDAHQEVRNVKGSSFELVVHPVRPGAGKADAAKAADEYLASCHFIDSADARVQALAKKAAGGEKDPWKKAQRIERWVKASMRVDNAAAMVPAS